MITESITPIIQTRQQLDHLLENIAELQRERDEVHRQQDLELNAVREKFRAPLAEIDSLLDAEKSWAETWARGHRESFSPESTLACGPAVLRFETIPPHVERASRRWTWSRIATTLAELPWGQRYLKTPPPEVDKEALAADLANFTEETLRAAGMKVYQGERFLITPHDHAAEPAWQEAA